MALPRVDRDAILNALHTFDEQFRNSRDWLRWEDNKAQVYALAWEGKLYPPKQILSLATGSPVGQFSGGPETNEYLDQRGFKVQRLQQESLSDTFRLILERYGKARRTEAFAGHHNIRELFASARRVLEGHPVVHKRDKLRVVTSYGKGNWATIPWISLLDSRETATTQDGVYVVYLFREDGAGVYVKLAQGVALLEKQLGARAVEVMQEKSGRLRLELQMLADHGFDLSGKSDLGADARLARLYEASTIASKYYSADQIPSDEVLFVDLSQLLTAYGTYVETHPRSPSEDDRPVALVGTWGDIQNHIEPVRTFIQTHGGWASPWSFILKDGSAARLRPPFYLYFNEGGRRITARARVDAVESSRGTNGLVSPWPDMTEPNWQGANRLGPRQHEQIKTWFRLGTVEAIEPFLATAFDPVPGLSTPENVLNQNSFGYVYEPDLEAVIVSPQAEPISGEASTEAIYDLTWLQAQTRLSNAFLREMLDALTSSTPQILLTGPPGTSKTWVAKALALHLTQGRVGAVRTLQFHPSYTYESFIEGLRPVTRDHGIGFELTPGVVLETVATMERNGHLNDLDRPYVLILDEANRANLPRVLGELLYLFEYRNERIRLQYSSEFSLPRNLFFIGTMNTADRSIRSLDAALRRRFDVFELGPNPDVLTSYLTETGQSAAPIVQGFVSLNERLAERLDRHHTIGHAFFMRPALGGAALERIWNRRVYPLIEEYFFDQPDLAKDFTFDRLWPVDGA